jgi:hypothetical protein
LTVVCWLGSIGVCSLTSRVRSWSASEPSTRQVHARVRNYLDLFEKDGPLVRSRYTVSTTDLPSGGAYEAAETRVRATDGGEMLVVSRVAYSVIPPGGETGAQYARRMSEERAWRILAGGGFEAGRAIPLSSRLTDGDRWPVSAEPEVDHLDRSDFGSISGVACLGGHRW